MLPTRCVVFGCEEEIFVACNKEAGFGLVLTSSEHFVPPITVGFHVILQISVEIADECGQGDETNGGGGVAFKRQTPFAGKVPPEVNDA